MKALSIFILTAFLALNGFCLEWKTLDGNVYKKVEVISKNPIGLYISYYDKAQKMTIVKQVKFSNLPEKIRKKHHYNPAKAKKYEEHLTKVIAQATAKAEIRAKEKRKEKKKMAKVDQEITNILNSSKMSVKLHIIKAGGGGVIAWASSYDGSIRTSMSEIFVLGVTAPQGDMWEGTIYSLNNTISSDNGSYNCYVTPFDRAFGIWKNRYIQTGSLGLKKKEGNK